MAITTKEYRPPSHTTAPEVEQFETEELEISMGPQHPSTHGVLRVVLKVDGEWVRGADPDLGYLHRAFEKMGELREYNQGVFLTDRWDYLSAMNNNLVISMAAEKLLGVEPPERAQWLRMLVCELQRIASHLVFIGTYGLDVGAMSPFLYCFRERELILDLFEMLCGARLTYNYIRIGGVGWDSPQGEDGQRFWKELERLVNDYLPKRFDELDNLLTKNKIFIVRTQGVGITPPELALSYGLTGPMIRACGIPYDVRRYQPYCFYDKVEFDVVTHPGCDCFARFWVRTQEMRQSLRIIKQVMERLKELPPANIMAKLPPKLKPPPGDAYAAIESPRGELGVYMVSDGSTKPWRMKIRGPAFVNLSVLPAIAPGWKVADFVAILGAVDIVMGEVDR